MRKKIFLLLLILSLLLCGCDWLATPPLTGEILQTYVENETTTIQEEEKEPEPQEPELLQVRLMSVGDNLVHDTVIAAGKTAEGGYDFSMIFENIKDYIALADLACINQETIFTADPAKYGGYPLFGTPVMMGNAIYEAGFNIVLHASNHSLDKTSRGVLDTLEFWQDYPDVTILGISGSEEDYNSPTIIEVNGISIALFNYTYGLNGLTPPDDKPWLVNVMSDETKDKIIADLQEVRGLVDFVIVYPHWGSEYVYSPDSFQKEWTQIFADCGVDLVIGAHPHVLQPAEMIERADGGQMLVYYSLGNFCSHQAEIPRMLGGLSDVLLCKQGDETWIEQASLIPVVTQIEEDYFTTYLLEEYTDDLAKAHTFNAKFGFSKYNPEALWSLYYDITGLDADNMLVYSAGRLNESDSENGENNAEDNEINGAESGDDINNINKDTEKTTD